EKKMPKASEVANELRKLADTLDRAPEADVARPRIGFWYDSQKEMFLETVKLMPRPLKKKYPKDPGKFERIYVEHNSEAIELFTTVYQSAVCQLIEPAKAAVYDCKPLLSAEEEASLEVA